MWANLPGRYPDEDLPSVIFQLDRRTSVDADWTENVASIVVENDIWPKLKVNDAYVFNLIYEGVNVLDNNDQIIQSANQNCLPLFDGSGKLYEYRLVEKVDWTGTDAEGQPDSGIFQQPSWGTP